MARRTLLLSWLIFGSAAVATVIFYGVYRDYGLLRLLRQPGSPVDTLHLLRQHWLGIVIIAVLVSGVVLELLRSRLARFINCGFYSVAFLSLCWDIAQHQGEHPEEQFIVLIFLLIPLGLAAAITIFLYWLSRRRTTPDPASESALFETAR